MDTRSKIIPYDDARRRFSGPAAQWVRGHFDPLLAEHVRLLRRYAVPGQALVVEVTNPIRPLLPQRARAELVAALAMVDYVVQKDSGPAEESAQDNSITERFMERVWRRHRGEVAG